MPVDLNSGVSPVSFYKGRELVNKPARYLNKSAIFIVALISLVIAVGQYSDLILSSLVARVIVTAAMFALALIIPSTSITIVLFGYFVPLITMEKSTLLPANYYFYFVMMSLSLIHVLTFNLSSAENKNHISQTKILISYVVLLFIIIISELVSVGFSDGSNMTLNSFLSLTLGLIGVLLIKKQMDEDMVLMTFVAVSVYLSGWTLLMAGKINVVGDRYEVGGFDQNYLSFFIGVGIVILISFLLYHRASLSKTIMLLFISFFLLNCMAILRLGSRGVVIGLIGVTAWFFLRNSRNMSQASINITLALLLVLVISQLPGIEMMAGRFHAKDIGTASRRLPLWLKSIDHIKSSSLWEFFFGGGLGAGKQVLKVMYRASVPLSPHNQYLETAMDYGVFGLASLLWLMYAGFKQSLRVPGYLGDMRTGTILFMLLGFMSLTPLMYVLPWIAFGFTLSTPSESKT